MKKKTKISVVLMVTLILVTGIIIGIGNYFFSYALVRKDDNNVSASKRKVASTTSQQMQNIIDENYQSQLKRTKSWLESVNQKIVSIVSVDNLSLSGSEFIAENNLHKYAIIAHGYTQNKTSIYDIAEKYNQKGYTVITPDLRAHGESDGKYIGMGWLDRLDMLNWISLIIKEDPKAKIVLHGISMGGATVMMTSGENLPKNVIAIVEDCGYTSVFDVFSSELKIRFNLPPFPIMNSASFVSKIRAGYYFKEASSINQIKKSTTPTLFIHGTNDNFIPVDMCHKIFDVASCKKEKLIINGAGHSQSRFLEPDTYYNTVFNFINM